MQSESNQRQIALVSYGTQYLRHGLALDDWYRHGIFFGARLQFRERDGNALLADDFTWWLGILRQASAQRLSLHRLAQFDFASPSVMQDGQHAVVVHYRDHYEVWAVGNERPAWLEHPLLPDVPGIPIFPDATHWGGAIDSYWRLGERPGQLEVAETDWKALARAIATDLDINLPSSHIPAGPLYLPQPEPVPWARFPLFASGAASSLAHGVLATLYRERSRFDNDMHPKNENSPYKHADEEGAAKIDDWGRRLDAWIGEVQLRCANECRQSVSVTGHTSEPPASGRPAPARVDAAAIRHVASVSGQVAPPGSKWPRRLGFVLVLLVVTLLVLACAHIVASWPWLAVLLALPVALYGFYRNS